LVKGCPVQISGSFCVGFEGSVYMGIALVAMQLGIKVMLVLEQMKELKLGD
jgi:arginine decarboxylase-like protein